MITHLENAIEQDGQVLPTYTGENAPHFDQLDDIGHIATLDVMVAIADYEDGADNTEGKVSEEPEVPSQATLFDGRPHLVDPELDAVWQAQVAAGKEAARKEAERRERLRKEAGTIAKQNENAAKFDREQATLGEKQVMSDLEIHRGSRHNTTTTSSRKAREADNSKQLQLIG